MKTTPKPKASKASKKKTTPKAAKLPKVPKAPKASKASKKKTTPKAAKLPKAPRPPKQPKASKKKTTPKAPKAQEAPRASETLRTWLQHPAKTVREAFERAIVRAQKSANEFAGVAAGRKRLEVRKSGDAWTVIDPRSGDEAPHVAREKRAPRQRSGAGESVAQFKRRMSREIDRDSKKKAAEARKKERRELTLKGKTTRQQRAEQLRQDRAHCKSEILSARAKHAKQPARRVAVAKTRTGCALRAEATEQRFGSMLEEILSEVQKIQTYGARKPRQAKKPRAAAPPRRVAREERDDSVRSELERRGLAHLIPIWEEKKHIPAIRDANADRAIERFIEAVEEDPAAIDAAQRAAEAFDPADLACEEAQHYAAQGDPQAVQYAEEHCDGPAARRGSPHQRTVLMYGDVPAPPEERPSRKRREKAPRERRGPLPGQQTLSARGASVLARGAQLGF